MATFQGWSVAKHDTVPTAEFWFNPLEGHAYMYAFLAADGLAFAPPYTAVRDQISYFVDDANTRKRKGKAPSKDVEDQRLRSWKALFEGFGLLYVDSVTGKINLTPLGRTVRSLYNDLNTKIEGANDRLARVAVGLLNRHLLRNPMEEGDYPADSDLHPYRFVWRAMRQLDNRLHWEEMNRVIMWSTHQSQEDEAINRIKDARKQTGGIYTGKPLDQVLGKAAVSDGDETKRRITPWFTRAGFGGLLISPDDDAQGYRHLADKYIPLLDEALQDDVQVPNDARISPAAYLRYLGSDSTIVTELKPIDESDVNRVLTAVKQYGSTKIICLSGIPGTGKSHVAKLVTQHLTEGDPYRCEEVQFHENITYENFFEGFVPKPSGEGFELLPKTFRIINRRARLDPKGSPYVLLIEELTRANVHAVLGELLTYVEHRNRPFRLAISQKEEMVAPNLVILATFNPRDKSALTLDHAILRRLYQLPFQPSVDRLQLLLDSKVDSATLDKLAAWYSKFLPILPFGHAVFASISSESDLRDLWYGTLRYFLTDYTGKVRDPYHEVEQEYPWR